MLNPKLVVGLIAGGSALVGFGLGCVSGNAYAEGKIVRNGGISKGLQSRLDAYKAKKAADAAKVAAKAAPAPVAAPATPVAPAAVPVTATVVEAPAAAPATVPVVEVPVAPAAPAAPKGGRRKPAQVSVLEEDKAIAAETEAALNEIDQNLGNVPADK